MLRFYDYDISAADIAYHASFDKGADVISYSWGGLRAASQREKELVKEVLDNGTVIVRSAGNEQTNSDDDRFPFAYQVDNRIIIVSSTDKNDRHTNPTGTTHANYPQVSICSPGYSIIGAIRFDNGNNFHPYGIGGGTSYATPMVAGVCALLKSVNKNLTPAQIKNTIQTTADPITDAYLYPNSIGAGRVNAYKALIHTINNTCSFISVTETQITRKVYCRNITLENATIPSGITLELIATESITIGPNVTVQSGGKLELKSEGSVSYNSNFTVETGASFINY